MVAERAPTYGFRIESMGGGCSECTDLCPPLKNVLFTCDQNAFVRCVVTFAPASLSKGVDEVTVVSGKVITVKKREMGIKGGEEIKLFRRGHSVHCCSGRPKVYISPGGLPTL